MIPFPAILIVFGLQMAAPAFVDLPRPLLGIWTENAGQCTRYRAALRSGDQDRVSGALVGAMVVNRDTLHAYAEYGEGNFYRAIRVRPNGSGRWIVDAALGIDTMPTVGDESTEHRLQVRRSGSRLTFVIQGERGASRYIWCAQG